MWTQINIENVSSYGFWLFSKIWRLFSLAHWFSVNTQQFSFSIETQQNQHWDWVVDPAVGSLISVARSGGIPPKWLFLASPWRENFGLAESAKSLNGGFFWTFLIFISKITKYWAFWKKNRLTKFFFNFFPRFFPKFALNAKLTQKIFFFMGRISFNNCYLDLSRFQFLKICVSVFCPIFAVKLIGDHCIKHLKS